MAATDIHAHPHLDANLDSTARRLALALALTIVLIGVEIAAGFAADSLALLTDAAHNFSDALAVGLSWWALRLARRPANDARTFGYHRAGILVALANAATLLGLALFIAFEALQRLNHPPEVREQIMLVVGVIAFVLNAVTALLLWRDSRHDLNVRSVFVHMAADALAVVGVVAAAIGIALFGWPALDAIASLLIAALILWSGWGIIRETVDILLESTPRGVDVNALVRNMQGVQGVRGVHDLHVWSIAANLRMLSAHVLTDDMTIAEGARVRSEINDRLLHDFGIDHTALQLEHVTCDPDVLYCELSSSGRRQCACQAENE